MSIFSPVFKNKNTFFYTSIWVFISMAHFLILYFVLKLSLSESILDSIVFNFIYAVFGLGLWFTVQYINVEKKTFFNLLLNHLTTAFFISFLWILFSYIILRLVAPSEDYYLFLNSSLFLRYILGLFYYAFIILIYYVVHFYSQYQEKKVNESFLVIKTQESELKRLRAQINPHFIFNTLNSISSLTMTAPEKAQEMVIKLSDFLRYSLKHDSQKRVTCKEELDNARLYMEIEKTRFGNRISFKEEIEPDCYQQLIPDMILQPIFENVLKHGVYESTEQVSVHLSCTCDNEFLFIKIGNSFPKDLKKKKGTGTGITNIQNRLRLIYGRNDLMKINSDGNYFEVVLIIPQH